MSNDESANNAHINTLVEKLRSQMRNFAVMDRQGELIGEVKDLMLDANSRLSLVVYQVTGYRSSCLLLLLSRLIKRIDPQNKAIFVDVSKAEMEKLPKYEMAEIQSQDASVTADAETQEQNISSVTAASGTSEILEEEIVRLLEERLVIDRTRRKVGEVIVRKEIETRIVQVPVRREKLIVEQVSPERKQLAEINLGQEEISGIELPEGETASSEDTLTVKGEFNSPKIASLLLNAIALERRHGCKKVRVQITVEDTERQKTYQEWVDRCSGS